MPRISLGLPNIVCRMPAWPEIYIEALLVDEELADEVWEEWDAGEADAHIACLAWALIAGLVCFSNQHWDV